MATEAILPPPREAVDLRSLVGVLAFSLAACAGAVEVEVRGELIAVHAEAEPLRAVLEAVAENCDVDIRSNAAMLELVTLDTGPRPLARLLAGLLRDHSYVLHDGADGRRLWILAPAGNGNAGSAWSAVADDQSLDELVLALSDPDREVRLEAVLALGDLGGAEVEPFLTQSLADGSDEVREAARAVLDDVVPQNSQRTPTAGTIGSQ